MKIYRMNAVMAGAFCFLGTSLGLQVHLLAAVLSPFVSGKPLDDLEY